MGHQQNADKNRKGDSGAMPEDDALAHRDAQSHDYKGEAQNVNDDSGRPLNDDELERARVKANESKEGYNERERRL